MRAEFEEKSYEQHLVFSLVHGRPLFFSPGQVLENILGFDVALRTTDRDFWNMFPTVMSWWRSIFFGYYPGTRLSRELWDHFEATIEDWPKFKFNCFIQAKRPSRMLRSDAAEYSSWRCTYFRYDTMPHQQQALQSLAQRTLGTAIVVYACPAFHTFAELTAAIKDRDLVKKSNFCEVEKLNGHKRYSFTRPGNEGFAHSDPIPVESRPFEQALDALQERDAARSNMDFLMETGETIGDVAENLGPLYQPFTAIANLLSQKIDGNLAKALAKIHAFEFVCNVQLLIGYEPPT